MNLAYNLAYITFITVTMLYSLHSIAQYCTAQHCTGLHSTALHCTLTTSTSVSGSNVSLFYSTKDLQVYNVILHNKQNCVKCRNSFVRYYF